MSGIEDELAGLTMGTRRRRGSANSVNALADRLARAGVGNAPAARAHAPMAAAPLGEFSFAPSRFGGPPPASALSAAPPPFAFAPSRFGPNIAVKASKKAPRVRAVKRNEGARLRALAGLPTGLPLERTRGSTRRAREAMYSMTEGGAPRRRRRPARRTRRKGRSRRGRR
jgi:hypothetical protein